MLFPERMCRLIWFVPQADVAECLQNLAATQAMQLVRSCHLGDLTHGEHLRHSFERTQQYERSRAARKLYARLPEKHLLHYAIGQTPDNSGREEWFIWGGADEVPETLAPHIVSDQDMIPMENKPHLSRMQWQLLLDAVGKMGNVADWFIIDGWVPASRCRDIEPLLAGKPALLIPAEQSGLAWEEVPVRFSRPGWLAGFGRLMQTFAVTGYREIDPALFLAFGFVLMFGLMFADLGQGADGPVRLYALAMGGEAAAAKLAGIRSGARTHRRLFGPVRRAVRHCVCP
jgi:hypothetical protein